MTPEATALAALYGGCWGEHPAFPVAEWVTAVVSKETRLGYWDWCLSEQGRLDDWEEEELADLAEGDS